MGDLNVTATPGLGGLLHGKRQELQARSRGGECAGAVGVPQVGKEVLWAGSCFRGGQA